jgi:hypothetical protein
MGKGSGGDSCFAMSPTMKNSNMTIKMKIKKNTTRVIIVSFIGNSKQTSLDFSLNKSGF